MEKKYVVWTNIWYATLESRLNNPPQIEPQAVGGIPMPQYKLDSVLPTSPSEFTIIWKLV
jgi:hypothetical protein